MRSPALIFGIAASFLVLNPAAARLWEPTPQQLAQDYSSIVHNKGGINGRVTITWFAAPGFTGNTQQIMEKYVVLSITHTVVNPSGLSEYQDIEGVQVTDQQGHALKEVGSNDVPPSIVSILASLEATIRQTTQGKGIVKQLVFEAGAVHACEKNSGLIVTFEGEKYTWETPLPGCTTGN